MPDEFNNSFGRLKVQRLRQMHGLDLFARRQVRNRPSQFHASHAGIGALRDMIEKKYDIAVAKPATPARGVLMSYLDQELK